MKKGEIEAVIIDAGYDLKDTPDTDPRYRA
jgi:hypothetical protein